MTEIMTPEQMQARWEAEFCDLMAQIQRKFQPGTLVTMLARNPTVGDSEFCYTMESPTEDTDKIRMMCDALDKRKKKVKVVGNIIDPHTNGFNVKVTQEEP